MAHKQRFFISEVTFSLVGWGFQSVRKLPIEIKTNPLIPKLSTNFKFPHSLSSNKAICKEIGQKIKIFHVETKTVHSIPNLSTYLKFSSKNGANKNFN